MRIAVILLALSVAAGESATETLKARDAEVRSALPPAGQELTPAARTRLERILTNAIDLRAMLESALGPRWRKMTESQRKRLFGAFEKRFRQTSGEGLDDYRTIRITYLPEESSGSDVVKVPTKLVVKGEPTQITYTMRHEKSGWRIVDIIIDDVSTVENYRASFARVISKEGVDGLIERLSRGPPGGTAKR